MFSQERDYPLMYEARNFDCTSLVTNQNITQDLKVYKALRTSMLHCDHGSHNLHLDSTMVQEEFGIFKRFKEGVYSLLYEARHFGRTY
jgi:hypothetical protein